MKVDNDFMYEIFKKNRTDSEEYKYLVNKGIFVTHVWLALDYIDNVGRVEMLCSNNVVELFESNFKIEIKI